jgi:ketosteroid isomerase-like protein
MSEENVEIARRAYAAALRRPVPDLEVAYELFDRDHVLIPDTTTVEGRTFAGGEGFLAYLSDIDDAFSSWEAKIVSAEEISEDRVLVELLHSGRSRRADVPWEEPAWYLATLRNGRIVRSEIFRRAEEALQAAGLSESGGD